MGISVVVLTFNAEASLAATLEAARRVSDDIHVVDSYSTDATLEIAARYEVNIVQHPFDNYGVQRNWAIDTLPFKYSWQLHLDADERLSEGLVEELNAIDNAFPEGVEGFFIARLVHFMNKPIRHGGMFPIWHLRLFRGDAGRCESRLYDQHFFVQGPTRRLKYPMIDDHQNSLTEWVARHNRWTDAVVDELLGKQMKSEIRGRFGGNPVERKRALRRAYYRLPMFVRPFLLFFYRYVIRLGFLDGKEGLIFFVLQTLWFRFLVDAKLFQRQLQRASQGDAG